MKRPITIATLSLLVVGLFAWGQVSIARDPLHVALQAQAASDHAKSDLRIALQDRASRALPIR